MASPRTVPASLPNTTRTYGGTARSRKLGNTDARFDASTSPSSGRNTSRIKAQASQNPASKAEPSNTTQSPHTDPYSLSDLDDEDGPNSHGHQVRKRKRSVLDQTSKGRPKDIEKPAAPKPGTKPRRQISRPVTTEVVRQQSRKPELLAPSAMPRAPALTPRLSNQPAGGGSHKPTSKDATPPRKQRRLIDALAAQKDSDSDSDNGSKPQERAQDTRDGSRHFEDEIRSLIPPSPSVTMEGRSPAKIYTPRTTDLASKSTKIKFTYSQSSRSMAPAPRGQSQVGRTLPEEPESDSIASSPLNPVPDAFDMSDASDLEDDKRLEIKSVHELRRAGANNRFSDELEDLVSRIGSPGPSPSTLRRNALLELSQKLQKTNFASQFRDHADRDSVAHRVGEEADVASGFALSAVLVQFLSDRPAPHLLCKLAADGIGKLLGRMLLVRDDIDVIASRKETNLSKSSRQSFSGVKSHLLQMDIWPDDHVNTLAPRTLALQLLDLLYRSSNWEEAKIISEDCLEDLSSMASGLIDELEGSLESDVNFSLLVSIMESQSNVARAADQEVTWLRRQSTNAADILRRALQAWSNLPTRTRMAALKMAINATNTSEGASAFGSGVLLRAASQCVFDGIVSAREAVENHNLDHDSYESLLLVLGVMINILEHCPSARGSMDAASVSILANLYAENRLAMSEADSEEKSRLSVAFGYLAVSLGYMSLSDPGLTVVRSLQDGQGVRRLLGSIRDFIDVYRNVDSKIHGLEGLVSELQTQLV